MKTMTLKLSRYDMLQIRTALTHIVCEYRSDIAEFVGDPDVSADCLTNAKLSLEMWEKLRGEVIRQIHEQM